MRKIQVFPSLLAADFADFGSALTAAERAGAEGVQLDAMDLHFVPNLTFGWRLVESMRPRTKLFLDAHLMIEKPYSWIDQFARAGADNITFHIEACDGYSEAEKIIGKIRLLGKGAGLAYRPGTPLKGLEGVAGKLDYVLIMTVEPGFGGQVFMRSVIPKIEHARKIIDRINPRCRLQVDGGINLETAALTREAGADSLVAGSAFYGLKTDAERKSFVEKARG
ncbi:MAG: ribulose-phosphate 3-epimerase [Candidatus Micrarchaeota archaeon]